MTTPSSAAVRYSKYFLVIGERAKPRIQDANPAEASGFLEPARFPPFARIDAGTGGGPLMMMWINVNRVFSAANSTQQEVPGGQSAGSVASYSWSSTGRVGGGTGSTATYNFSTVGLETITCTVTDDSGTSITATRWVRVVTTTGPYAPITAFEWGGFAEELPERGFGGARIQFDLYDSLWFAGVQEGRMVALYHEHYEDGVLDAGEVFCGFIERVEHDIDPRGPKMRFTAHTIEGLLSRPGMDSDYHVFIDRGLAESFNVLDSLTQTYTSVSTGLNYNPFHNMPYLSIGKIIAHLLHFHIEVEIAGTTYALAAVIDLLRDWWNDGTGAGMRIFGLGLQRAPLMGQIAAMLPHGMWTGYSSRLSQLSITQHHVAKDTPDAAVDTIDEDLAYAPVRPMPGQNGTVRQVVIVQADPAKRTLATVATLVKHPDTPAASGSLVQPSHPFWFSDSAIAQKVAKGIYDYMNNQDHVEFHLPGATFGIFNKGTVTVSGYWTGASFYAVRVVHQRSAEHLGGHRQVVTFRRIVIS